MKIDEVRDKEKLTIKLDGTIDGNNEILKNKLQNALEQDVNTICLDMDKVSYISSAGLCVLIAAYKQSLNLNKRILITKMSDRVREVIRVVGILKLLTTEEDYLS